MRDQLHAYIDRLFAGTVDSQAARDFHDELLQNTLDRFDEEIANGKTEEEAYRIAVLSLGQTAELLKPFYPKRENTNALRTVAVILYCTSFVPIILLATISSKFALFGVALMFTMIAAATTLMILSGRTKPTKAAEDARLLRALGVGVIISSLSMLMLGILYENVRVVRILPAHGAVIGLCAMFCTIAAGIGMLVAGGEKDRARTVPHVPPKRDCMDEQAQQQTPPQTTLHETAPQQSQDQSAAPKQRPAMQPAIPKWVRIPGAILTAIYWVSTVALFMRVSLTTGAWYYTWVIFVLAGGLYAIARSIVRLCCGLPWFGLLFQGFMNLAAGAAFYYLTIRTGLWYITWLVFPIAGCLTGVANGIIQLTHATAREVA
ncbi:MAG: hypothetical protein IJP98_01325 [Clostridia bacterium]|nr:hypothetical protein [Clostridia bacterium]